MAFEARSAILQEIGTELQAGVLAYVTGDRENFETEIGADVLPRLPRHLEAIGQQNRLALVLYTLGGDVNTPWRFVSFLRSDCDELHVLVPFWAHSAGTLIALGADKIYLARFGTLSPIDPSVTNEFQPGRSRQPGQSHSDRRRGRPGLLPAGVGARQRRAGCVQPAGRVRASARAAS